MNRILLAIAMMTMLVCGVARADDAVVAEANAPGVFEKYVADPTRWLHRGVWGVLTVAIRIGKAPVDKAFEMVGIFLKTEPNTPTWE